MKEKEKPKKNILSDHKKVGSIFIAPFSQLGFTETTWSNRLPELIWMGLLNHSCGYKRGVEIASEMAKAAYDISPGAKKRNYGEASSYKHLSSDEIEKLLKAPIVIGARPELQEALQALNILYPESPLAFLGVPSNPLDRDTLISVMNRVVSDNLNKRDKPAMFLQANLIYIGGICGFLFFSSNVTPPNLDSLKDYPDSEESKKTAASIRAMAQVFTENPTISDWAKYFWNQGLKIEPCRARTTDDRD